MAKRSKQEIFECDVLCGHRWKCYGAQGDGQGYYSEDWLCERCGSIWRIPYGGPPKANEPIWKTKKEYKKYLKDLHRKTIKAHKKLKIPYPFPQESRVKLFIKRIFKK